MQYTESLPNAIDENKGFETTPKLLILLKIDMNISAASARLGCPGWRQISKQMSEQSQQALTNVVPDAVVTLMSRLLVSTACGTAT